MFDHFLLSHIQTGRRSLNTIQLFSPKKFPYEYNQLADQSQKKRTSNQPQKKAIDLRIFQIKKMKRKKANSGFVFEFIRFCNLKL